MKKRQRKTKHKESQEECKSKKSFQKEVRSEQSVASFLCVRSAGNESGQEHSMVFASREWMKLDVRSFRAIAFRKHYYNLELTSLEHRKRNCTRADQEQAQKISEFYHATKHGKHKEVQASSLTETRNIQQSKAAMILENAVIKPSCRPDVNVSRRFCEEESRQAQENIDARTSQDDIVCFRDLRLLYAKDLLRRLKRKQTKIDEVTSGKHKAINGRTCQDDIPGS